MTSRYIYNFKLLFWWKTIFLTPAYSKNGKFTFSGEKISGGMYLVVLPNQQYFDIVISEQYFSFSANYNH